MMRWRNARVGLAILTAPALAMANGCGSGSGSGGYGFPAAGSSDAAGSSSESIPASLASATAPPGFTAEKESSAERLP